MFVVVGLFKVWVSCCGVMFGLKGFVGKWVVVKWGQPMHDNSNPSRREPREIKAFPIRVVKMFTYTETTNIATKKNVSKGG